MSNETARDYSPLETRKFRISPRLVSYDIGPDLWYVDEHGRRRHADPSDGTYLHQTTTARPAEYFWFLVPASKNKDIWYIIHADSGKAVTVLSRLRTWIGLWDFNLGGADNQKFKLVDNTEGTTIVCVSSGDEKVWGIPNSSTRDGTHVIEWPRNNNRDQMFNFYGAVNLDVPPLRRGGREFDIGPPPKHDHAPPRHSEPVLIGESYIPFMFVTDPVSRYNDRRWAVNNSPYYILTRHNMWNLVTSHLVTGAGSPTTHEYKQREGIETSESRAFEVTAGLGFTGTLGTGLDILLKGLTAGLEATLSVDLKASFSYTRTEVREVERNLSMQLDKPGKNRQRTYCLWQKVDRYSLRRAKDENPFRQWDVLTNRTGESQHTSPVKSYRLDDRVLDALRRDGLPEDTLKRLAGQSKRSFEGETAADALDQALHDALGEQDLEYGGLIRQRATTFAADE